MLTDSTPAAPSTETPTGRWAAEFLRRIDAVKAAARELEVMPLPPPPQWGDEPALVAIWQAMKLPPHELMSDEAVKAAAYPVASPARAAAFAIEARVGQFVRHAQGMLRDMRGSGLIVCAEEFPLGGKFILDPKSENPQQGAFVDALPPAHPLRSALPADEYFRLHGRPAVILGETFDSSVLDGPRGYGFYLVADVLDRTREERARQREEEAAKREEDERKQRERERLQEQNRQAWLEANQTPEQRLAAKVEELVRQRLAALGK